MKKFGKISAMLLAVLMMFSACPLGLFSLTASAEESTKTSGITGGCKWEVDGTVLTISRYDSGLMGDYEGSTPWEKNITEVIIKKGVTNVGWAAFRGCAELTKATIPDGVTIIDYGAFDGCEKLTEITIPDSVTSIGSYAFFACTSLASVKMPDGVTSIGYSVFNGCEKLTEITVPDSVTSISSDAFENTGYYNDEKNWNQNVLYIGNHLIAAKSEISGNYEIEAGTKTIAENAFNGCTLLTSITIPNGVTSIGEYVFSGCTLLTNIKIPDSLTNIGWYAFDNTGYYDDEKNWNQNVLYIGNHLIAAKSEISGNYEVKAGTKNIVSIAFVGCSNLTSITIPDSVISIGDSVFYNCTGLTRVTIPNSVASIGSSAFSGCTSLASVNIPEGITNIGWFAFSNCTSLTSIIIPNSVTYINSDAFYGCPNVVIYGSAGSYAETFAKNNGIKFVNGKPLGDANGDGRVDILDLISLKKRLAETGEDAPAEENDPADVDKNNKLNASDIAALRKILLGIA